MGTTRSTRTDHRYAGRSRTYGNRRLDRALRGGGDLGALMAGGHAVVVFDRRYGWRLAGAGVRATFRASRRLSWRYRTQLAPLMILAAMWVVGTAAHSATHPVPTVLFLGAVVSGLLWRAVRRRLDRPAERRYALACGAAAFGWLLAAAAYGTGRPMPALLWLGGCALAMPWWWHHRIRGVPATGTRLEEMWAERVAAAGRALPGSSLLDVRGVRNGVAATIALPPGERSTEHAVTATPLITSAFEKPIGSVLIEQTPDGIASRARLLVLERNPLHAVQPWTGPSLDRTTGVAPVGVYADGGTALFRFWTPESGASHTVVAGTTGSGKSRFLDELLAEASHSGLLLPWLIDPQHGQSLPRWIDHVDWAALGTEQGLRALAAAQRIMHARSRHLARVEWTDERGRTMRGRPGFDPTPEMPLLLIVLEEAHELLKLARAVTIVEAIGKMGRKTGIGVVLVTQLPSVAELGGSMTIRSMLTSGNVVVFRTADRVTSNMAFSGALPVDPSALPREFPGGQPSSGLGYLLGPSARTVPMRAYYVEDPYHWASTAPRLPLDELSVQAAGEDYPRRHEVEPDTDDAEDAPPPAPAPAPGPRPSGTAADAVLAVLADAGETARAALITATGYSPRAITDALAALTESGRIVKTGHGRYALAPPGDPDTTAA
jgi:hypothetical protein